MPPLLHIMRHGQGYHNISDNGHDIRDPDLTDHGREQCRATRDKFQRHDQIELLLASPLRRALQTCEIAFESSVKRGLKIIALPMAEEASDAPCDTGSDLDLLKATFPHNIDFDHVEHGWYVHEGEYAFTPAALIARAAKLRRWIKARPEKEIVLVAHGYFNHYLTGDVREDGYQTTPWWTEAELRTYEFQDGAVGFQDGTGEVSGEDGAGIVETAESLRRLEGDGDGNAEVGGEENGKERKNEPARRKTGLEDYQT